MFYSYLNVSLLKHRVMHDGICREMSIHGVQCYDYLGQVPTENQGPRTQRGIVVRGQKKVCASDHLTE